MDIKAYFETLWEVILNIATLLLICWLLGGGVAVIIIAAFFWWWWWIVLVAYALTWLLVAPILNDQLH